MKKSKVIIPALAVLVLSTAASVTGTVAWFTATRERTVTAGEFKVAKTGENLEVAVSDGIGTTANNVEKSISLGSNILTDASFNHTLTTENIINPNSSKTKVQSAPALSTLTASQVLRDENTYSAVTWNMAFSISFGAVEGNDLGLFLEVDHDETYIHEKFVAPDDDGDGAGTIHTFTAKDAGTYFTDAACTTGSHAYAANDTVAAGTVLYKEVPDESGKGFRIAFVPTAIAYSGTGAASDTHGSVGYTKIWAPHRAWNSTDNSSAVKFVNQDAANDDLTSDNYDHNTTKFAWNGSAYAAATATAGANKAGQKVVIDSSVTSALPDENTLTDATALSGHANYLAKFDSVASTTATITFTCVAWYDGTDEDVENDKELETVVASMHFKVIDLVTA